MAARTFPSAASCWTGPTSSRRTRYIRFQPADPSYWFNPAAFAVQPAGTFGNLGRNALYGPGQINWDMALTRRFTLKERWKLDFRADFFNIMNHANWNNPGTSNQSSTFGEVTTFYQSSNTRAKSRWR